MPDPTRPSAPTSFQETRLRVFRIEQDTSQHVRLLSGSHYGVLTHWTRSGSRICEGDVCPVSLHRTGTLWKGYFCADVYDERSKLWLPVCLEVTESMELDLRDRTRRGQVWRCYRGPQSKKHKSPCVAEFVEVSDETTLPREFNYKPLLQHVYHHPEPLPPHTPNPMPPRILVRPSEGPAPTTGAPTQKEEFMKRFLDEQDKKRREASEKWKQGIGNPQETNGHGAR